MHGLKKTENVSFFVGAVLTNICVGRHDLILDFDNEARITIESFFTVSTGFLPSKIYEDFVEGCQALLPLLGELVADANVSSVGGLVLLFESQARLEIFDSNEQYESFLITYNGKQIAV